MSQYRTAMSGFAEPYAGAPGRSGLKRSGWWLLLLILLGSLQAPAQAVQVFNQPHNGSGVTRLSAWWDPDGSDWDAEVWDSFLMGSNTAITEITWRGGHDPAYSYYTTPVLDFTVAIFPSGAMPSWPDVTVQPLVEYQAESTCEETPAGVFGGTTLYDYHYVLPSPFQATAGVTYWVQIIAWQHGIPDWGMAAGTGNGYYFRHFNEGGYQTISGDCAFALYASSAPTATITTASLPANGGTTFGGGAYPIGSTATVQATPASGWGFVNWTENGVQVRNTPDYTFTVSANRSLVANFVPSYTVVTHSWPAMGGTTVGDGAYNSGSSVTVTAEPAPGYSFVDWYDGSILGTDPSYTFTINQNRQLYARFAPFANTATFDFDTGTPPVYVHQSLPSAQTQNGLTATFATPLSSWSIQNTIYGFVPRVFSENFVYPSGFYNNEIQINFSRPVTDFTVSFCTADLESTTDTPTAIRVRAYPQSMADAPVQTVSYAGNWITGFYPEGRLDLASPEPFSMAVIDIPWGGPLATSIFFIDNIIVQMAPVTMAMVTADVSPPGAGTAFGSATVPLGSALTLDAVANTGFVFTGWQENGQTLAGGASLPLTVTGDRSLVALFEPEAQDWTFDLDTGTPAFAGGEVLPIDQGSGSLVITISSADGASHTVATADGLGRVLSRMGGNLLAPVIPGTAVDITFSEPVHGVRIGFATDNPAAPPVADTVDMTLFEDADGLLPIATVSGAGTWNPGDSLPQGVLEFHSGTAVARLQLRVASGDPAVGLVLDNLETRRIPELVIEYDPLASPGTVRLSWPAPCSGYRLQRADGSGEPVWQDVSTPPLVIGDRNTVPVVITGETVVRFRLWHL